MFQQNSSNDTEEETILRRTLATLDVQRKSLEHEADAIYLELTTPPEEGIKPMGLDTPLVDQDGYPRGDIDLYRTRTLRNRFRVLQTDHKELVRQIDALLVQLAAMKDPSKKEQGAREAALRSAPKPKPKFDSLSGKWVVMNWDGSVAGVEGGDSVLFTTLSRDVSDVSIPTMTSPFNSEGEEGGGSSGGDGPASTPAEAAAAAAHHHADGGGLRPFARIDAVADDSPAKNAGLLVEDLLVYFGRLNSQNHNRLRAIAELVPEVAAESGEVIIRVLRQKNRRDGGSANNDDDEIYDYEDDPDMFETVEVSLKPQPWSGRGLIGCHIVPYKP